MSTTAKPAQVQNTHADKEKAAGDKHAAEAKQKADKEAKEALEKKLKAENEAKKAKEKAAKEKAAKAKPKRIFDLNRDTTIRYFGYMSEVGYCSRSIFNCAARYLTLLPAWSAFTFSYIVRDAYDKGRCAYVYCPPTYPRPSYLRSIFEWLGIIEKAKIKPPPTESQQRQKACIACGDALIWQGLASVIIPALLMRNTQHYGRRALCYMGAPRPVIRYAPPLCALAILPLFGKPIDKFVDTVCDSTYRFWFSDY